MRTRLADFASWSASRGKPVGRPILGNRPGMARREPGAAIEGEVWALPTTAIGTLLALVPAPLGFGMVALEDGPCLGFLAEAQALDDATDITPYGGWRAWLAAKTTS